MWSESHGTDFDCWESTTWVTGSCMCCMKLKAAPLHYQLRTENYQRCGCEASTLLQRSTWVITHCTFVAIKWKVAKRDKKETKHWIQDLLAFLLQFFSVWSPSASSSLREMYNKWEKRVSAISSQSAMRLERSPAGWRCNSAAEEWDSRTHLEKRDRDVSFCKESKSTQLPSSGKPGRFHWKTPKSKTTKLLPLFQRTFKTPSEMNLMALKLWYPPK